VGKRREGVMVAPLRLFDETPLVHVRLSSSAAFRCAQMVCRADPSKGSPHGPGVRSRDSCLDTNTARRPDGSDTANVRRAAASSGG
jgi:hypothetical protein